MTREKTEGWRSLIRMVIAGLIVAAVAYFGFPELFEKDTELKDLSYSIEGPKYIMNPEDRSRTLNTSGFSTELIDVAKWSPSGLTLNISGFSTSSLFEYNVSIWNSGEVPLKNLPIRFVFDTSESDFKLFKVEHDTKPKHEFGEITEQDLIEDSGAYSRRFIYTLLNPKDEDIVTLWTNYPVSLSVYAKSEGLNLLHRPFKK